MWYFCKCTSPYFRRERVTVSRYSHTRHPARSITAEPKFRSDYIVRRAVVKVYTLIYRSVSRLSVSTALSGFSLPIFPRNPWLTRRPKCSTVQSRTLNRDFARCIYSPAKRRKTNNCNVKRNIRASYKCAFLRRKQRTAQMQTVVQHFILRKDKSRYPLFASRTESFRHSNPRVTFEKRSVYKWRTGK